MRVVCLAIAGVLAVLAMLEWSTPQSRDGSSRSTATSSSGVDGSRAGGQWIDDHSARDQPAADQLIDTQQVPDNQRNARVASRLSTSRSATRPRFRTRPGIGPRLRDAAGATGSRATRPPKQTYAPTQRSDQWRESTTSQVQTSSSIELAPVH